MNQNANQNPPQGAGLSIAAVERETGIGKDTLRVWERRYGFPAPDRDAHGERLYPPGQVVRLREIRRLMDLGWRPGKIFATPEAEIRDWLALRETTPAASSDDGLIALIRVHESEALRAALQQRLLKEGLQRFVVETLAPLNISVGSAWEQGRIKVSDEHLYSEVVQTLLRAAINQRADVRQPPRVLLTTLPEEQHGLGLLMAEALLVSEGAYCVSLGTRTPITDIAAAANTGNFDIVALSFSAAYPYRQIASGLKALSDSLPAHCEIWAGGAGLASGMSNARLPKGISLLGNISEITSALFDWRQARAA